MHTMPRALAVFVALSALGCSGANKDTASPDAPAGAAVTRVDVALTTSDGVNLTGFLATSAAGPASSPGVVLVHQFQQTDEQWGDLIDTLAGAGYRVLAFNLRGHGDSDAYSGDLTSLLTDPNGAPLDVDAAIAYLAGDGGADPARIAVVGTSIGANLAVAAAVHSKAKTYVSLSARIAPTEALAGQGATGMQSVFYVAGETEAANQGVEAQTLHDATADPRQVHIVSGSADHGIAILRNHPDVTPMITAWLAANL